MQMLDQLNNADSRLRISEFHAFGGEEGLAAQILNFAAETIAKYSPNARLYSFNALGQGSRQGSEFQSNEPVSFKDRLKIARAKNGLPEYRKKGILEFAIKDRGAIR